MQSLGNWFYISLNLAFVEFLSLVVLVIFFVIINKKKSGIPKSSGFVILGYGFMSTFEKGVKESGALRKYSIG